MKQIDKFYLAVSMDQNYYEKFGKNHLKFNLSFLFYVSYSTNISNLMSEFNYNIYILFNDKEKSPVFLICPARVPGFFKTRIGPGQGPDSNKKNAQTCNDGKFASS